MAVASQFQVLRVVQRGVVEYGGKDDAVLLVALEEGAQGPFPQLRVGMVQQGQELLAGHLALFPLHLQGVAQRGGNLVEEPAKGLHPGQALLGEEALLPLGEGVLLELAQRHQEVAVVCQQGIVDKLPERLVIHLDDLEVEEEEFPPHGVAEFIRLLGQALMFVALAVGGKEEVGVELRLGQLFLQALVAPECLQERLRGQPGDLAAVEFPEGCDLCRGVVEGARQFGGGGGGIEWGGVPIEVAVHALS